MYHSRGGSLKSYGKDEETSFSLVLPCVIILIVGEREWVDLVLVFFTTCVAFSCVFC